MAILKDHTYRSNKINYTPNKIDNLIYPEKIDFIDTKPNILQIKNFTNNKIYVYDKNLPLQLDTNGNVINNYFMIDTGITRVYTSQNPLISIFIAGLGNGYIIINSAEGTLQSNDLETTINTTILGG